jgi:hypothetical protein
VIGPEGSAKVLQLAIQAVTPLRCEVERNFPVESFSLHLPLTLATTVFEPMVLPGWESDSMPDPRAAGSDGYHTINVGCGGRSVKYDHRSYSANEAIAFSQAAH